MKKIYLLRYLNKLGVSMFKYINKLKWYFYERRFAYLSGISVLLLSNVVVIANPWVLGKAIDSIATGSMDERSFFIYITLLTFLSVSEYFMAFYWGYKIFENAVIIDRKLTSIMMKKIIYMKAPFFEKFNTGDLMTRATSNIRGIQDLLGYGVMATVDSTGFGLSVLFAMLFLVSWKLTIVSILPYIFLVPLIKYVGDSIHKANTDRQVAVAEMSDEALESIAGIRVVRAYTMEEVSRKSFNVKTEEVKKQMIKENIYSGLMNPMTKVFLTISFAISIFYGALLISKGELTVGQLMSFNIYLHQFIWPMYAIGEGINVVQRGNVSISRVYEVLEEKNYSDDNSEINFAGTVDEIVFRDYSFTYPKSLVENLTKINLSIKRGESIGIVGKTGSGKTTFIKQLLKEYPSGEGEILINNINLDNISTSSFMNNIGYVSQDNILFSKTIRENIFFSTEDKNEDKLKEAIKNADFEKDLESLPDGLETLVGERGVALSGGQKQRVSLARAFIKNPDILILDDSLSAVDAKTEHRIIENIRENRKGKTTIIIAHRLSAVEHADKIIVLDNGVIVEEGNHKTLIENGGWYSEQYKMQSLEEV